jgi:hypothetical protein
MDSHDLFNLTRARRLFPPAFEGLSGKIEQMVFVVFPWKRARAPSARRVRNGLRLACLVELGRQSCSRLEDSHDLFNPGHCLDDKHVGVCAGSWTLAHIPVSRK